MNVKFDLLIIFWDGSKKIVKDVSGYGISSYSKEVFYYEKNGHRNFLPVDKINFIGKKSDYLNQED